MGKRKIQGRIGGIAQHANSPQYGGVCESCRCDLFSSEDGHVYCRNDSCLYSKTKWGKPHPTGQHINHGGFCDDNDLPPEHGPPRDPA